MKKTIKTKELLEYIEFRRNKLLIELEKIKSLDPKVREQAYTKIDSRICELNFLEKVIKLDKTKIIKEDEK